jgi:hypothetical protein
VPGDELAGVPASSPKSVDEVLNIGEEVFETADWNFPRQLDHLALLGDERDAAFDRQTRALREDRGGYLCAGMATYLSYVLSRRGYKTAVYNSGSGSASHVLTLVEVGDGLYVVDAYTGLVAPRFRRVLSPLLTTERPDYTRIFQPMDEGLEKDVIVELEPGQDAEAEDADGLTECRRNGTGMLVCKKAPGDYATYDDTEAGIAERTGVTDGLFLTPLNVQSDDKGYLFSRYPFLEVLDRHSERFREADASEPDPDLYRRLVADLRRDLAESLEETPASSRP